MRHNELRDFTAELLSECCKDVSIEPGLQSLTGEKLQPSANKSMDARVDVAARGFWVRGQMAYFDVRIFNPTAKTYLNQNLSGAHRTNEQQKKRQYNERILTVDQASFTPLVFSCFGGMGKECSIFFKKLAVQLSEKKNEKLSKTINWIRTRINFHLLRSCLLCVRGSRTIKQKYETVSETDISVVHEESNLK